MFKPLWRWSLVKLSHFLFLEIAVARSVLRGQIERRSCWKVVPLPLLEDPSEPRWSLTGLKWCCTPLVEHHCFESCELKAEPWSERMALGRPNTKPSSEKRTTVSAEGVGQHRAKGRNGIKSVLVWYMIGHFGPMKSNSSSLVLCETGRTQWAPGRFLPVRWQ